MKVAFTFSGLPHYLVALLNKLVSSHGIEVSLVIPRNKGISIGEGVKLDDVEKEYLFSIFYLDEFLGKFSKPYFRNLHETLDQIAPDVLVIGWPYIVNYSSDSVTRKAMKNKNISLIFREIPFMVAPRNQAIKYYTRNPVIDENLRVTNPRGLLFYPWAIGLNLIRKRYYRLADATLIYSTTGIKTQESFGIGRENIFVTYNSPDTEKLAEMRKKLSDRGVGTSNTKRILHLGRLVKWKRVDLLIEAVDRLSRKHDTIELCIIGTGPEDEYLRRLVAQKALEGKIRFLGAIYNPEDLAREIISSAVYVLAGMGGLSINEAMSFGKPVVCSRCDGTEKDLVTEGETGFYFKEGDAVDLAEKIDVLLSNPERAKIMGSNALSVIQEKINLQTVAQQYVNCFNHVMKKKSVNSQVNLARNHGI